MTQLYNRQNKKLVTENDYQAETINFLYQSKWGKKLLPLLIQPLFSKLYVWKDYTFLSKPKIQRFIKDYQIDLSLFEDSQYNSFNAFFKRKYKENHLRKIDHQDLISVAQAKLQVFPITDHSQISIKGQNYQFHELITNDQWSDYFLGGWLFVYRLSMPDYHRYLYSEGGRIIERKKIKGKLHTIREIAQQDYKLYKENQREYCIIETHDEDYVLQMEIGALTAGKIHNLPIDIVEKAREKGYFSLGGSTIIVAYAKDTISLDQDIEKYSGENIETLVELGERLGKRNVS